MGLLRIAGAFETVATAAANQPAPIGSVLKLPDQERSSDPADKGIRLKGKTLRSVPHDKAMQIANYDIRLFLGGVVG